MIRALLASIAPPICVYCSAISDGGAPLCRDCRGALRWLGHDLASACGVEVWAPVAYEGPARALVKALKFGGMANVAEAMASQIAANAPPHALSGTLVPVPLHTARLRRRGYNQAALLARGLSERARLPVADCLERSGGRATQVGRDRRARLRGIVGSVSTSAEPPPAVVLVDDVITTGATLAACAETLRAAGAERVTAVAYARTPGR